jgi:hypothetical protein
VLKPAFPVSPRRVAAANCDRVKKRDGDPTSEKLVPFEETCPLRNFKDLRRRHRNGHNSVDFCRETWRGAAEYLIGKPSQPSVASERAY